MAEEVFYIYGRFWSLSAKWSPKNGLYNISYGHLEYTNKILNVSNLNKYKYFVLMSVYIKKGYINRFY